MLQVRQQPRRTLATMLPTRRRLRLQAPLTETETETWRPLPIPHSSAVSSGHRHVAEGPSIRDGDGDVLRLGRHTGEGRLECDRLTGLDELVEVTGAQAAALGVIGDSIDVRGGRLNERDSIDVVLTSSRCRLSAGLRNRVVPIREVVGDVHIIALVVIRHGEHDGDRRPRGGDGVQGDGCRLAVNAAGVRLNGRALAAIAITPGLRRLRR